MFTPTSWSSSLSVCPPERRRPSPEEMADRERLRGPRRKRWHEELVAGVEKALCSWLGHWQGSAAADETCRSIGDSGSRKHGLFWGNLTFEQVAAYAWYKARRFSIGLGVNLVLEWHPELYDDAIHRDYAEMHSQKLAAQLPVPKETKSKHGPLSREEYLCGRKVPQIFWLLRKVQAMQRDLNRTFRHALDVGGGRGDLAMQLAKTFERITVVDSNAASLSEGWMNAMTKLTNADAVDPCPNLEEQRRRFFPEATAKFVGLGKNSTEPRDVSALDGRLEGFAGLGRAGKMEFVQMAFTAEASLPVDREVAAAHANSIFGDFSAASTVPPPIDLVVALHACGGLTDEAIAFARSRNIAFLVVPCCYTKIPATAEQPASTDSSSRAPLAAFHDKVIASQLADTAGKEQTFENLCLLAESTRRDLSFRCATALALLRVLSLFGCESCKSNLNTAVAVDIEAFPSNYSQRNLAIAGAFSNVLPT
eukprot:gnl/TRDRNA2_/TRDRNA2_141698_c0_seq3.p1 gnl/TRDRNA2_/TRDRNA2_141698_c0~~gnl/TRDRNA2_/TRDRNA2_141698_c0_seq3.p1  ORF type:complete len:480 (-),score=74.03 gnl/TRDRNA2_/TRDRNA2_141698_c0_seq3:17-1456(-)